MNKEAMARLIEELERLCDDSDGSLYGTLSTALVRSIAEEMRSALYQPTEEKS